MYTRAPAAGLWREDGEGTRRGDIVVYEVMADALDEPWRAELRSSLQRRFQQERLVIRAQEVRLL